MILLHRLKGQPFWLNPHLIETIESGADTVILLTNERKYVVSESAPEIVERILALDSKNIRIIDRRSDEDEGKSS
ncbi:MAG: flagellar FlbD family protein [Leptospiraceae bacterium]|nr:flagellar FlbD family protein [Leptospiraceae bacterium]